MSLRLDDLNLDGLKVYQETDYFCFGIDSVLLANFVKSNSNKNVIVDFCSGSGVIPIIMSSKKKYKKIYAVELQNKMFELLLKNISFNNLEHDIIPINLDISKKEEILKSLGKNEKADIIVCNPPYKKAGTGVKNENDVKYIARHEVFCNLEDIFSSASYVLKDKGKLYLVHKPDRLADLFSIARKYNLEPKKIECVHPKASKAPSIVLIEYIKNGGNELIFLDPIIEYNEDGTYTEQIIKIYNNNC